MRLALSSLRHLVWADIVDGHGEASFAAKAAFGFARSVSNRGKGTFERVGGADMLQVFGKDVTKGAWHVSLLGSASQQPCRTSRHRLRR
jgi:hypothetical protein|tara:strand:- start:529 stop:795 length:267 start_codon:yes stop_codon:yes gene_type:complete